MSLMTQIVVMIGLIISVIPAVLIYFFLPETIGNEIDLEATVGNGVVASLLFIMGILVLGLLYLIFPLLAIVLTLIPLVILYQIKDEIIKDAKYNYTKFHMDKEDK